MKIWEQLIADTTQLGGTLIFIEDQAPADFREWLRPLQGQYSVPVTVRSVQDLLSRKFLTKSQDLVVFFESQKDFVLKLNAVVQGQRLLLGKEDHTHFVDFTWSDVTLACWLQTIRGLDAHFATRRALHEQVSAQETACLFLDRDDVVVKNVPYNRDPDQVVLMPGAVEVIKKAHRKGLWVALVTNQSGIGRGRISWLEYKSVHQRMLQLLAEQGCWIDECVWASFIENEAVVEGRLLASLRKPRAGMFQLVHDKLRTRMESSYMVGDSATDLIAAHSAQVANLYLFHSDKFAKEEEALREYQKSHPQLHYQVLKSLNDMNF